MKAKTPEEIYQYMRWRFRPYGWVNENPARDHIIKLIQEYAKEFAREQIAASINEVFDGISENSIQQ